MTDKQDVLDFNKQIQKELDSRLPDMATQEILELYAIEKKENTKRKRTNEDVSKNLTEYAYKLKIALTQNDYEFGEDDLDSTRIVNAVKTRVGE